MGKSVVSAARALTLLGALFSCAPDRPEDQVRKAFEVCRGAVEVGDATTALARLDPAFRGPDGMDKAGAQLFLLGAVRQGKVDVTVVRNEVSIRRGEAYQDVDLILTSHGGDRLPQEVSHHRLQLQWHRAGGDWKLTGLQSLDGR
jgi:hypothetical protein